ncbi:MAG: RNA 2',3'-cyclic phosphodiesterase [Bacteroidales bacterium]|nr:RNA 2',3'-cyclic phosphodiesterase [Bacteroidales bacterium]
MKRLFIAIDIIPSSSFLDVYAKIKSVSTKLDKINWVKPDLIHATLKFLGETPEEKIPSIMEGMNVAASNIPSFSMRIGTVGAFGSRYQPRVLWFGIQKTQIIEQLHNQLQKEMRKLNFKYDFGNFVPHITIARINRIDDKQRFWKTIEASQTSFIQEVEVRKIILYESILKTNIPVYQKAGEISLLS